MAIWGFLGNLGRRYFGLDSTNARKTSIWGIRTGWGCASPFNNGLSFVHTLRVDFPREHGIGNSIIVVIFFPSFIYIFIIIIIIIILLLLLIKETGNAYAEEIGRYAEIAKVVVVDQCLSLWMAGQIHFLLRGLRGRKWNLLSIEWQLVIN